MTKEEKLKKIIEYSMKRGWALWIINVYGLVDANKNILNNKGEKKYSHPDWFFKVTAKCSDVPISYNLNQVIFDFSFLNAFFGIDWQPNAQQLVIAEDRIEYLYNFLKTGEKKREI